MEQTKLHLHLQTHQLNFLYIYLSALGLVRSDIHFNSI